MGVRLTCRKCGKVMGFWAGKMELANHQYICNACCKEYRSKGIRFGEFAKYTINDIENLSCSRQQKSMIKSARDRAFDIFPCSVSVARYAKFDDSSKKMLILTGNAATSEYKEITYSQLSGCYLYADFKDESGTRANVVGGAIAGSIINGENGAVVGAIAGSASVRVCNRLEVKVGINNGTLYYKIPIVTYPTKEYKVDFYHAKQIKKKIDTIIEIETGKRIKENGTDLHTEVRHDQIDTSDNIEAIRKYKALADEGVITQEEFEAKKKQLLGL